MKQIILYNVTYLFFFLVTHSPWLSISSSDKGQLAIMLFVGLATQHLTIVICWRKKRISLRNNLFSAVKRLFLSSKLLCFLTTSSRESGDFGSSPESKEKGKWSCSREGNMASFFLPVDFILAWLAENDRLLVLWTKSSSDSDDGSYRRFLRSERESIAKLPCSRIIAPGGDVVASRSWNLLSRRRVASHDDEGLRLFGRLAELWPSELRTHCVMVIWSLGGGSFDIVSCHLDIMKNNVTASIFFGANRFKYCDIIDMY